jgi:hypothetical protein
MHLQEHFLKTTYIEIQFDYKSKYTTQVIYNKKFPLPKQRTTTIKYCHLKNYFPKIKFFC